MPFRGDLLSHPNYHPIMRYLLLLLLCPFLAQAQTPSNCQPSTQLLQHYGDEIKQLALNYLYTSNHPDTITVEIPSFWSDRVASGMMAVLSSNLPQADSIFNYYCVHHHWVGINNDFYIGLDTQYTWARNLHDGVFPTGHAYVDSLMRRHELYRASALGLSQPIVSMATSRDSAWNMRQLVRAFQPLMGVRYAEEGSFIGDGSRITYADTNGVQTYTFSRRWGDCPLGCTCWRTWTFQVDALCQVTYLGNTQFAPMPMCQFGNNIPQCNAFNSVDRLPTFTTALKVYPNPSSGLISIEAEQEAIEEVLVFGLDGRLLHQETPNTNQVQLNIPDHWPTGMYLLQARIQDRVYHEKLILQR